jgi:hypothetical protein
MAHAAATQAVLSRVLTKQTTCAVTTTLRAIAHRAAAGAVLTLTPKNFDTVTDSA